MNNLSDILLEYISDDKANEIIYFVKSEAMTDEIANLILKMASNNIMNREDLKSEIEKWSKDKNLSNIDKKNIERALSDYDPQLFCKLVLSGVERFDDVKQIITPLNQIEWSDLIGGSNIYSIIKNKNNDFPDEALKEIADYDSSYGGTARGKFEILINLFLKGDNNSSKIGDIRRSKGTIEIKKSGGRLMSQKIKKPFIDLRSQLSNIHNIHDLDSELKKDYRLSSQEAIRNIILKCHTVLNLPYEIILDRLIKAIETQVNTDIKISNNIKKEIINEWENNLDKDKSSAKLFVKLMGCMQLYAYKQKEGFDYIMIFADPKDKSKKEGDYIILSPDVLTDINNIWVQDNISFSDGGGEGTARDAYCRIHYKKDSK